MKPNINPSVEAARTQQCGVEHIGTVCGRQQDDARVLLKTIHLRQELVEGLFAFIVAAADASTPLATNCINLIDENDAGGLFFGLAE